MVNAVIDQYAPRSALLKPSFVELCTMYMCFAMMILLLADAQGSLLPEVLCIADEGLGTINIPEAHSTAVAM